MYPHDLIIKMEYLFLKCMRNDLNSSLGIIFIIILNMTHWHCEIRKCIYCMCMYVTQTNARRQTLISAKIIARKIFQRKEDNF